MTDEHVTNAKFGDILSKRHKHGRGLWDSGNDNFLELSTPLRGHGGERPLQLTEI